MGTRLSRSTLRGRILIASVLSGVFIVATLAVSSFRGHEALTRYMAVSQLASDKTMWKKILDVQVDTLQERLSHIVTPDVVDALRDGDRDRLREYAVPPYNRISSLINLTQLNFYNREAQRIFSAHDPDQTPASGMASQLVNDALSRRTIVHGIGGRGDDLAVTVVVPVYSKGHLIGVVEAAGSVIPIVEDVGRTLYAKASLVSWPPQQGGAVKVFASSQFALQSLGELQLGQIDNEVMEQTARGESGVINGIETTQDSETSVVPVLSYEGSIAAALLVGRDIAPLRQSLTSLATQNVLLSLIGVGGALFFVSLGIRRSLGRMAKMTSAIEGFARGHIADIPNDDGLDEVSTLGNALRSMIGQVSNTHKQLQESERRANEASTAKSMFIANMSHELRTPLNAIIGYSELIRDELSGRGDVRVAADAGKVHQAAVGLLAIINDLLDVAKLDTNRMQVDSMPVKVATLVREVIVETSEAVRKNNNQLKESIAVGDEAVLVDPSRMKQVLAGVIKNAAKFTNNGQITLSVTAQRTPKPSIVFEIQDTGIGIANEALPGLFSPFSQVDQSTTRRHGGLGIGLAISKRLCELMRGTLEIASDVGVGTTVRITLPEHVSTREAA